MAAHPLAFGHGSDWIGEKQCEAMDGWITRVVIVVEP